MTKVMMKCGHAANGTIDGKTGCVICGGLSPNAVVVDDSPSPLEGRTARCYCGRTNPSTSQGLAFFRSRPERDADEFYCGHAGWD